VSSRATPDFRPPPPREARAVLPVAPSLHFALGPAIESDSRPVPDPEVLRRLGLVACMAEDLQVIGVVGPTLVQGDDVIELEALRVTGEPSAPSTVRILCPDFQSHRLPAPATNPLCRLGLHCFRRAARRRSVMRASIRTILSLRLLQAVQPNPNTCVSSYTLCRGYMLQSVTSQRTFVDPCWPCLAA